MGNIKQKPIPHNRGNRQKKIFNEYNCILPKCIRVFMGHTTNRSFTLMLVDFCQEFDKEYIQINKLMNLIKFSELHLPWYLLLNSAIARPSTSSRPQLGLGFSSSVTIEAGSLCSSCFSYHFSSFHSMFPVLGLFLSCL
jgi:hypothetical protein